MLATPFALTIIYRPALNPSTSFEMGIPLSPRGYHTFRILELHKPHLVFLQRKI